METHRHVIAYDELAGSFCVECKQQAETIINALCERVATLEGALRHHRDECLRCACWDDATTWDFDEEEALEPSNAS